MGLLCLCGVLFANKTKATVFTAVASGNFNAAATWGGSVPSSLLSSDVIVIPAGFTVTLTNNVTFSSTASLTVLGNLNTAGSGVGLIMVSGALTGSGTIDVDSFVLGLGSGITYTGNIMTNKMTSLGTNISSATNITVRKTLTLSSGVMAVAGGTLNMGMGSTITLNGGSITSSGSGTLNFDSTYNVVYMMSGTTGAELSGSGLDSVTVNASGAVSLSSNTNINGMLILKSGMLSMNNHNLTFSASGNLSGTGSGTLSATASSSLMINSTTGLMGALNFTSGSNTLNNITVNMGGSSSLNLGSDLNVNGTLLLQSGKVKLGTNNLKINAGGMISGGGANSYVVADGTGKLVLNLAANGADTFAIGTATDYTPMVISANSGSVTSDVGLSVSGSVLSSGTTGTDLSATQPMVKNTWFITSSVTSGFNFTLMAMWNSGLEVNSFNRTQAYISHYTSGSWDVASPSSATVSGGMYTMTRAGITSLSPFMVTDKDAVTTSVANINFTKNDIILYPNPTGDKLYFQSSEVVDNILVYDIFGNRILSGKVVNNSIGVEGLSPGTYYIHLTGENMNTTRTFIKQ